jgi:flagellar motor switch protein FliG
MGKDKYIKEGLSTLDKAAIVLSALDEDTAAEVLRNLSPKEIQMVTHRMAQMEHIPFRKVKDTSNEFVDMVEKGETHVVVGFDRTKNLLNKALGEEGATYFIDNLDSVGPSLELAMMESVGAMDPKVLADFTKGEHPQTIAIIMANLPPNVAAASLSHLGQEMKNEVLYRIAELKQVPTEILMELADVLRSEMQISGSVAREMGGAKPVAEILNHMDSSSEKQFISQLEEDSPSLADEIKKLMFMFDDLGTIDDRGMQQLLREIDSKTLAMALRAANDDVKDKFLKNMSQRAAEMLVEDMETMGPTRLSEIEQSQQEIIRVAKRLEDEGRIVVAGKGSDEVFI